MSKMTWFKLHSDFRNDPKIKRLPITERYAFIVLLCLASESETRGTITGLDDDDIAFELEMQSEDWQTLKAKFKAKGFIDFTKDQVLIRNWDKRQYDKPSDHPEATKQRKRLQREKIKFSNTEDVTPMSRDVTPMSRGREEEIRLEEIREDQKDQEKEIFFAPDDLEISSPEKKIEISAFEEKPEDPKTPPLPPLSVAAQKLQERFEGRFKNKPNRYAPQGLVEAGFGEWHLGEDYDNWRPSLIKVAQQVKRELKQPCEIKDATKYLYNTARQSRIEGHWGTFKGMTKEAIVIEQSQARSQQPTPQSAPLELIVTAPVPSNVREFAAKLARKSS